MGRSVDCKGSKLESLEGFPKTFGANGDLVNLDQNEKLGDIQDIRWAKDLKKTLETLDKPNYVKIIKENVSNAITAMRDSFNKDLKTTNSKKL